MSDLGEKLRGALGKASPKCRTAAFEMAFRQRSEATNELLRIAAESKESLTGATEMQQRARITRTIPVFEALAALESEGKGYRTFAELGFALKDQTEPKWQAARERLEEARRRRDAAPDAQRRADGFLELNIAACMIEEVNAASAAGKPADADGAAKSIPLSDEDNERIIGLLLESSKDPRVRPIVLWHMNWKPGKGHYRTIARWCAANPEAAKRLSSLVLT